MMLVSILTPVYQVEGFIERCVRSVFEQTYPYLEFIFVDDCSPDNSCQIIQQVMDEYPQRKSMTKIIHHSCHRGLAAARNTSLDNATGDYICMVDSDDWMEKNAVELMVKKQIESSADIVAGNVIMHSHDGDVLFVEKKYESKEDRVLQQLQITWDHVIWRRIIRRSLFEINHIRCIEGCDMAEDRYLMALLAYYAGPYSQIDDVVYHYERRNAYSIMAQKDQEKVFEKDYQYLLNWLAIRDFFADKEEIFSKEAWLKAMQFLRIFHSSVIRLNSKKWYDRLALILDKEKKSNQVSIGWTTEGLRGFMLHNFYLVEANRYRKQCVRFIKRMCLPKGHNHV